MAEWNETLDEQLEEYIEDMTFPVDILVDDLVSQVNILSQVEFEKLPSNDDFEIPSLDEVEIPLLVTTFSSLNGYLKLLHLYNDHSLNIEYFSKEPYLKKIRTAISESLVRIYDSHITQKEAGGSSGEVMIRQFRKINENLALMRFDNKYSPNPLKLPDLFATVTENLTLMPCEDTYSQNPLGSKSPAESQKLFVTLQKSLIQSLCGTYRDRKSQGPK